MKKLVLAIVLLLSAGVSSAYVQQVFGLIDLDVRKYDPTIEHVYIQNETLTGTNNITADNIYVGRNVTNRQEYGDVVLGSGNITLNAGYVEIRNSTTVPLGTTLTINN